LGKAIEAEACTYLCVNGISKIVGSKGLQVKLINKAVHYVKDNSPKNEDRYSARFKINNGNLNIANGNAFRLFEGRKGSKLNMYLMVRRNGAKYQMKAFAKKDGTGFASTAWVTFPKFSNVTIEVDWKAADTKGNHNGYIKLYVNGKLKKKVLGINNDTLRVTNVKLGITKKLGAGTNLTGSFKLDAFKSDEYDYIGP
ncbi:MAG: hypothetical protein N2D54_07790, partial [Chloroflexota bacterium]